MATYSAPFKGGTVAGISGTSLTVAGFTPDAGDVGRLVVITSGDARLQHREITAVSGQVLTIAHAMDTNPFIDPTADQRASDVLPSNGDSCVVSYDAADLIASDADMTLTNNNHLKLLTINVSGGAYVHFKNYNLELNSANILISQGAGILFGYYSYVANQDGYMKDVCNIVDINNTFSGLRADSNDFGLVDIYGGTMHFTGNVFWRCYSNASDPVNEQLRMIAVNTYGGIGGRVDGNRSMLILSNQGSNTTVGIFNPRSAVARVEFTPLDCSQGGYVFTSEAPEGRAVFPRIANVTTRLLRVTGNNPAAGSVYEVVAKKPEVDLVPVFFNSDSNKLNHTVRYGNLVRPKMVNPDGSATANNIKTRLYDATDAFIEEQSITDASYTELFVRHTDVVSSSGNRTLANGTQFAPYSLRLIQSGKQFTTATITAEDTFEPNIVMLDDSKFTAASKTAAIAEGFATAQNLYNYAVAWLEDNITNETEFLFDITGNKVTTKFNVHFNDEAAADFAFDGTTITLNLTTLTGNLTSTQTVSFENTETVAGQVSDVNGTTGLLTLTGIFDSGLLLVDDSGNTVDYQANFSGTYSYSIPANATGTWQWVVYRPGYSQIVGSVDAGTLSASAISYTQKIDFGTGTAAYGGMDSANINFAENFGKISGTLTGDVTAKFWFDEIETFLATEDGCKWLIDNPTALLLRISTDFAGQVLVSPENVNVQSLTSGTKRLSAFVISTENPFDASFTGSVSFNTSEKSSEIAAAVWAMLAADDNTEGGMASLMKILSTQNVEIAEKVSKASRISSASPDISTL